MVDPLIFSFMWMSCLLDVGVEDRTMDWAHDLCVASQLLHSDVWKGCFTTDVVQKKVLKLLTHAKRALSNITATNTKGFDSDLIKSFKDNTNDRLRDIKDNYLRGNPPAILPGDKLRELINKALVNNASV